MFQIIKTHRRFIRSYNEYKDKIHNFLIYRLNGDQATAEDLTSEVFIKAYENFDSYNDQFKFSTWIYRIAQNTLIDHFRKLGRRRQALEPIENAEEELSSESVERDFEIQFQMQQVYQHLKKLPDLQQECILLKYLEGFTHAEIALITQKTEVNVRKLLSRGIKSLNRHFKTY